MWLDVFCCFAWCCLFLLQTILMAVTPVSTWSSQPHTSLRTSPTPRTSPAQSDYLLWVSRLVPNTREVLFQGVGNFTESLILFFLRDLHFKLCFASFLCCNKKKRQSSGAVSCTGLDRQHLAHRFKWNLRYMKNNLVTQVRETLSSGTLDWQNTQIGTKHSASSFSFVVE